MVLVNNGFARFAIEKNTALEEGLCLFLILEELTKALVVGEAGADMFLVGKVITELLSQNMVGPLEVDENLRQFG